VPCFDELKKTRRSCAVVFYAFDLLALDGKHLGTLALLKRKASLKRILRRTKKNRIRFTEHIVGEGSNNANSKEWSQRRLTVSTRAEERAIVESQNFSWQGRNAQAY